VAGTARTAATTALNIEVDIRPLIRSVFKVRTSCSGLLASGCREVKSSAVPAGEFVPLLMSWLQAMQGGLPKWAARIDAGDHTSNVASNLGMQAEAYVNLIDASRAAGIGTELMLPLQGLMKRGVAAGKANADLTSLVELLRSAKQVD